MTIADAIRALHSSDGHRDCGARATQVNLHQFSGNTKETRLRCTLDPNHEGLHKDQVCCYSFHEFSDEIVDAYEPRDLRKCTECGTPWPCKTIKALQEAEAQPVTLPSTPGSLALVHTGYGGISLLRLDGAVPDDVGMGIAPVPGEPRVWVSTRNTFWSDEAIKRGGNFKQDVPFTVLHDASRHTTPGQVRY